MTDATPTAEERIAAICMDPTFGIGSPLWYQRVASVLAAHAAQAVEGYRNALTAMEAYLEPDWSEARDEVLASGNAGWTMMAKLAIENRTAQAVAEERERCLAVLDDYFAPDDPWASQARIAMAIRSGQPGQEAGSEG